MCENSCWHSACTKKIEELFRTCRHCNSHFKTLLVRRWTIQDTVHSHMHSYIPLPHTTRSHLPFMGAMLVRPRPKILGCCYPWTTVSLGYFAPYRTIPSLNSDLIERSDTRLPTVARFSAAKRWSSMCGPSVHPTEGCQPNKPGRGVGEAGQAPHWSIRRRRPTEAALAAERS